MTTRQQSTDQRPLRIVHTESSRGWGGQEIRILTEMQGMAARGHLLTLVCAPDSQLYAAAKARGMNVVALPVARKRLRGVFALWYWLKRQRCDIINTHSTTDAWLVALARLGLYRRPRVVRTRHISKSVSNRRTTAWLYQKATAHIVTTGEMLRQQLIDNNGFDAARITSVPTGIDTQHFSPASAEQARAALQIPQRTYVGIVATLRSWKGHEYLMQALAAQEDRRLGLIIVGDGPQENNLRAKALQLGISDRVIMPGRQDDVVPWLRAMNLFVLPSYASEGVPQSIMQAMACGLPVISTHVGAVHEAVSEGETGLLVPAHDVPALSAAIADLLNQPQRMQAMGQAARQRALENFGSTRMLDAMQDIFRRVLA